MGEREQSSPEDRPASPESATAASSTVGQEPGQEADLPEGAAPEGDPSAPPDADYGFPFTAKTFGGAFVWARSPSYNATILRIREGQNVVVSTHARKDMVLMLTGGRAVLEVTQGGEVTRDELALTTPTPIGDEASHRLIALTEVEIMTIYSLV